MSRLKTSKKRAPRTWSFRGGRAAVLAILRQNAGVAVRCADVIRLFKASDQKHPPQHCVSAYLVYHHQTGSLVKLEKGLYMYPDTTVVSAPVMHACTSVDGGAP